MGAAGSVDSRVMLEDGALDLEHRGGLPLSVVTTRMLARPPGGGAHAMMSEASLAHMSGARDGEAAMYMRRAMYPLAPSNNTDRMVMLMEALVEFLEAVEGNLTYHEQPDNRTPHTILDRLPCRAAEGGDAESECYICLASFEAGDQVRILPCKHEFHCSCVDKWLLDVHRTCPCCRLDICASAEGECDKEAEEASVGRDLARSRRAGNRLGSREMAIQGMRRVGNVAVAANRFQSSTVSGVGALETRWSLVEGDTDRVTASHRQAQRAQRGVAEVGEAPPVQEESAGIGRIDTTTISLAGADEVGAAPHGVPGEGAAAAMRRPSQAATSLRVQLASDLAASQGLLGYYIIKVCLNPAYFRVFVSLGIVLMLSCTKSSDLAALQGAQRVSLHSATTSPLDRQVLPSIYSSMEGPVALRHPRQPGAREELRLGAVASPAAPSSPSASSLFALSPSAARGRIGGSGGPNTPASHSGPSPPTPQGLAGVVNPAASASPTASSPSVRSRASRVSE